MVMPRRSAPQLAIGRVTGTYLYLADAEPGLRHSLPVEWLRTDVPRTAVHQDLLYSLGAFITVCQISKNDAAWRIEQLAATGTDPGARTDSPPVGSEGGPGDVTDPDQPSFELERWARDRITSVIAERYAGHGLAGLVADILTAEGYVCEVAPPGADGGIDIFAGRGPLGLDAPRLIVQVKSGTGTVDARTVRELHGVLSTHGADQALLVAWGGINNIARRELQTQRFSVRVWDADALIEALFRAYPQLPEETQAALPLKQVWTYVEEPAAE